MIQNCVRVSRKTQTFLYIASHLMRFTLQTITRGKLSIKWDTFWCSPTNGQTYHCSIEFHAPFLGAFAKLQKVTISFVVFVYPHGTTQLHMDGFSCNLKFEYFSKISLEKLCLIIHGQA